MSHLDSWLSLHELTEARDALDALGISRVAEMEHIQIDDLVTEGVSYELAARIVDVIQSTYAVRGLQRASRVPPPQARAAVNASARLDVVPGVAHTPSNVPHFRANAAHVPAVGPPLAGVRRRGFLTQAHALAQVPTGEMRFRSSDGHGPDLPHRHNAPGGSSLAIYEAPSQRRVGGIASRRNAPSNHMDGQLITSRPHAQQRGGHYGNRLPPQDTIVPNYFSDSSDSEEFIDDVSVYSSTHSRVKDSLQYSESRIGRGAGGTESFISSHSDSDSDASDQSSVYPPNAGLLLQSTDRRPRLAPSAARQATPGHDASRPSPADTHLQPYLEQLQRTWDSQPLRQSQREAEQPQKPSNIHGSPADAQNSAPNGAAQARPVLRSPVDERPPMPGATAQHRAGSTPRGAGQRPFGTRPAASDAFDRSTNKPAVKENSSPNLPRAREMAPPNTKQEQNKNGYKYIPSVSNHLLSAASLEYSLPTSFKNVVDKSADGLLEFASWEPAKPMSAGPVPSSPAPRRSHNSTSSGANNRSQSQPSAAHASVKPEDRKIPAWQDSHHAKPTREKPRPNISEVERAFERMDDDGDGLISKDEFVKHVAASVQRATDDTVATVDNGDNGDGEDSVGFSEDSSEALRTEDLETHNDSNEDAPSPSGPVTNIALSVDLAIAKAQAKLEMETINRTYQGEVQMLEKILGNYKRVQDINERLATFEQETVDRTHKVQEEHIAALKQRLVESGVETPHDESKQLLLLQGKVPENTNGDNSAQSLQALKHQLATLKLADSQTKVEAKTQPRIVAPSPKQLVWNARTKNNALQPHLKSSEGATAGTTDQSTPQVAKRVGGTDSPMSRQQLSAILRKKSEEINGRAGDTGRRIAASSGTGETQVGSKAGSEDDEGSHPVKQSFELRARAPRTKVLPPSAKGVGAEAAETLRETENQFYRAFVDGK